MVIFVLKKTKMAFVPVVNLILMIVLIFKITFSEIDYKKKIIMVIKSFMCPAIGIVFIGSLFETVTTENIKMICSGLIYMYLLPLICDLILIYRFNKML